MREFEDDLDREIARDLGWDTGAAGPKRGRGRPTAWRRRVLTAARAAGAGLRGMYKVLAFPVLRPAHLGQRSSAGHNGGKQAGPSWGLRLWDALTTRLLLAPVFLAVFVIGLVWFSTHPPAVLATRTPGEEGMVYRTVSLASVDGTPLAAWYIPPITVDDVVESGERILGRSYPGAVLCHGLGYSHDQYLPLARRLHDAGFAVLLLDVRGQGESPEATVTFGLRERFDIMAAANYLAGLPTINPQHISVVGQGMGGSAALQAAALDPAIRAVVAEDVWPTMEAWLDHVFDRPAMPTAALRRLYWVAFELMVREHAAQLDLRPVVGRLERPAVLFVAGNQEHDPPPTEVMALAGLTVGPHRVLVAEGTQQRAKTEVAICRFLQSAAGGEPQGPDNTELLRLLQSQVLK